MKQILVMFHNSAFTAVIGRMDRVESHFYHRQLSNTFSVPVIPNNEEVQLAIEESNVEPLKFSPIKKVKLRTGQVVAPGLWIPALRPPGPPLPGRGASGEPAG